MCYATRTGQADLRQWMRLRYHVLIWEIKAAGQIRNGLKERMFLFSVRLVYDTRFREH